jgi:hypothetical protein
MVGDGDALAMPVVVEVETACGLPVSGKTVAFSVPNGTASPSSGTSDSTGQVTTQITAGCSLGSSMATATSGSLTDTISFTTQIGPAYAIALSKPANVQVPGPMTVHAEIHDRCGNLVATDSTTAFTLSLSEATADASASFTAVTIGTAVDTTNPQAWIVRVANGIAEVTLTDTAAETITFLMADSQGTGLQLVGGGGTGYDQTMSNVAVSCNGGTITVNFPAAPSPLGNGTITVSGTVDSDDSTEYLYVYGEGGTLLGTMFGAQPDCAFQTGSTTVSQSQLQSYQADGTITLQITTGLDLDCFCAPDQVSVELSYPAGTTADFTP